MTNGIIYLSELEIKKAFLQGVLKDGQAHKELCQFYSPDVCWNIVNDWKK